MTNRALWLALVVTLGASCDRRAATEANLSAGGKPDAVMPVASATPARSVESLKEAEKLKEVPAEFAEIDFKNLSYPASFKKGSIPLKDGSYEYEQPDHTGGDQFDFAGVYYADLTGDGRKEAIVRLRWIGCGASCDGSSTLFYVYAVKRERASLLWRFEAGSMAYGCGLKSFNVRQQVITLEVFGNCRFKNVIIDGGDDRAKFVAEKYTRFVYKFNGRKFAQVARKVFSNPNTDIRNYPSQISISDD